MIVTKSIGTGAKKWLFKYISPGFVVLYSRKG